MTKIVGYGSIRQRHGSAPKCNGSETLLINRILCLSFILLDGGFIDGGIRDREIGDGEIEEGG
jgi:hypothetical protein